MRQEASKPCELASHWQSVWVGILAVAVCGCASYQPPQARAPIMLRGNPNAPSQVTPSEALSIAAKYVEHPWRPFARNILHGKDGAGVHVDTPDIDYKPKNGLNGWWVPGLVNRGIPYKWGGFDDLETFDEAIARGAAAGDVSSPIKRAADNAAVSQQSAGVDCSGFVSRCLRLPVVHDTVTLPGICDEISSIDDLRPGDILNIPRGHVILVAGWVPPGHEWIYYYETGGIPDWKPALKQAPLDKLLALGFKPLRYQGMAREDRPSGKEVLSRSLSAKAIRIENPEVGAP